MPDEKVETPKPEQIEESKVEKQNSGLTDFQQKAINLFNDKCKNTILLDLIENTHYALFMVDPIKLRKYIQ